MRCLDNAGRMNLTTQCALCLNLAKDIDQIADAGKYLLLLEESVILIFKGGIPFSERSSFPASINLKRTGDYLSCRPESFINFASQDEEKLMLVQAIKIFHEKGCRSHRALFSSMKYHHHAALFIQELLESLSGNSKDWFRELQVASLEAIQAIVRVVAVEIVRSCLPGMTSAAVRYLERAHHGKDSAVVSVRTIDLLSLCLKRFFLEAPDEKLIRATSVPLLRSLQAIFSADAIIRSHYDPRVLRKCRILLKGLLGVSVLSPEVSRELFRVLLGGFLVSDNLWHIHQMGLAQESPEEGDTSVSEKTFPTSSSLIGSDSERGGIELKASKCASPNDLEEWDTTCPAVFSDRCRSRVFHDCIGDVLRELRGVVLLHAATTTLRLPVLRVILLRCGLEAEQYSLFSGLIRRCVRLIALDFSCEDFYTYRVPRRHPVGVVDEFIETLSHALAGTPFADEQGGKESHLPSSEDCNAENASLVPKDKDGCTAGELLTNALLEEAQSVLQDWDMYALHPATVYFIGRLIIWQFKPIPHYLRLHYFSTTECAYPYPADFIECTVLEQLWSVIGLPHLWNIDEDEELCNVQQIYHRRLMAATTIRVLDLAATDVMLAATQIKGDRVLHEGARQAFDRFCAVTLYPIMEKVAVPGFVHEAALHCLDSYSRASGEVTPFGFFSRVSDYIVDEASRGIKRSYARDKAVSVLAGSLRFLGHLLSSHIERSSLASSQYRPFAPSSCTDAVRKQEGTTELSASDLCGEVKRDGADSSSSGVPRWWFAFSSAMPLTQVVQRRLSSSFVFSLTQSLSSFASTACGKVNWKGTGMVQVGSPLNSLGEEASEIYFVTVCASFTTVLIELVATALANAQKERFPEVFPDAEAAVMKGLLSLLRDAMDIAALLNYSTPQEVVSDESMRFTTSANEAVKQLQGAVLHAMKVVQTYALGGGLAHGAGNLAVEVIIRGFTSCLTTTLATESQARRMASRVQKKTNDLHDPKEMIMLRDEMNQMEELHKLVEGEEEEDTIGTQEDTPTGIFSPSAPRTVPWFLMSLDGEKVEEDKKKVNINATSIFLPRALLPVVYQTYLPLVALLQEPISRFVTSASRVGGHSRIEQCQLKEVRVTDVLSAALTGLHALVILAQDFLQHRYVTDLIPVVMVWYERTLLPSIPTPTETKAKERIMDFVRMVKRISSQVPVKNQEGEDDKGLEECLTNKQVDDLVSAVEESVSEFHRFRQMREESSVTRAQQRSSKANFETSTSWKTQERKHVNTEKVLLTRDDLYIIGNESS